jgi:hypothetical protein
MPAPCCSSAYALAAIEAKALPSVMATAALLAATGCVLLVRRRSWPAGAGPALRHVRGASESLSTLRLSPELD